MIILTIGYWEGADAIPCKDFDDAQEKMEEIYEDSLAVLEGAIEKTYCDDTECLIITDSPCDMFYARIKEVEEV